jgi:hypothetical protein
MPFKCSFDNAKQSFFRSFNAVCRKIGGFAKDELLIQLVKSECLPSLLYATEALPLSKADINSLEFTFNRILFNLIIWRKFRFFEQNVKQ